MFAKLKEHSRAMDVAIAELERNLETKLKPIFSVLRYETPESSAILVQSIIDEVAAIGDEASSLLAEQQNLNEIMKEEFAVEAEILADVRREIDAMEDHLQDYGYVKRDRL